MICLDNLQACANPECRLVLPADPEDWHNAGFSVAEREDGRVVRWRDQCKKCVRRERRRRKRGGLTYHKLYYDVRDGEVVRLKVCKKCREEKRVTRGSDSEFTFHLRPTGEWWAADCKECINEGHRERLKTDHEYAARRRVAGREANRRWRKAHAEAYLASGRAYKRRMMKENPERVRELARMNYVLRQERLGRTVRTRRTVVDGTRPRVPAEPFREYLEAYAEQAGLQDNREALARALELTPRRVRSVFAREYEQVALDVVDRALTRARWSIRVRGRLVITLDDLYGEES